MNKQECNYCDLEFEWQDSDEFYTSDIVDGQYTEYLSVTCPHCECTNYL